MATDALYCRRVRARVRVHRAGPFFTLKNAFSGIFVVIRPGEIEVSARHVPASLGRILGVHYTFAADGLTVTEAEVGWMGTRLESGLCLILEGSHGKRHVELAVRPLDGDLEILRRALRAFPRVLVRVLSNAWRARQDASWFGTSEHTDRGRYGTSRIRSRSIRSWQPSRSRFGGRSSGLHLLYSSSLSARA